MTSDRRPDDETEGDDLTPRQARFVELYVLYGNGAMAAREAGYAEGSADVEASRQLGKAKVRAAVEALRAKVSESTGTSIERVVLELHRILTADPLEGMDEWDCLKPLREWPEDLRRALSGFESEELKDAGPEGETIGHVRKVKFWSKTEAANLLLKKLGGFAPERHVHEVTFADLVVDTRGRGSQGAGS